jgi:hypothetical protein
MSTKGLVMAFQSEEWRSLNNKTCETWPMRTECRELLKCQQKRIKWRTVGKLGYIGHENKEAYASDYFQDCTAFVPIFSTSVS